jgi:large subunit ribosomal protein L5
MANDGYVPRLREHYDNVVRASLGEQFNYSNGLQTPRLDKIVVNIGAGEAVGDSKKIISICGDLATITGQKPVVTHAKKSIANFKLREGMPIGAKVTLRRTRMYEFMDRLVTVALVLKHG